MNWLNPFKKEIKVEPVAQHSTRFSLNEIRELKKSLQKGKYLQKSFTQGRARTGEKDNQGGLSVSSNISSMADATDELRRKRLLAQLSNNAIVQAILRTRASQVMKFCHPARFSNNNVGFRIQPKNPDSSGKLTNGQRSDIKRIERFIYNTGCPDAELENRDKFPTFITKLIRNHFIYDQVNVERVFDPDNPDKLDHFNLVDAGTIVLNRTPEKEDSKRSFLQYTSTTKRHPIHFDQKHMTFVTSHGGQVNRHGYGYSDVEAAINELQFERDTESYNARFFSQGGTTRGILVINTEDDDQASAAAMKDLREQWQSSAQGLSGAWKIPVISANDASFVDMSKASKDMEFENWLDYLINIICAHFKMAPDEINFPNRGGGATGRGAAAPMNEGNSQRNRLQHSKDKGLLPLLDFIQDFINDHILIDYAPQYRFMFTLGDDKNEVQHEQLMQAKENNGMTVNEWRKQEGLPILNVFNNAYSKLAGPPNLVIQQLQVLQAQADMQNKQAQAQSDIKNNANPNHQNTQVNTPNDASQQLNNDHNNTDNEVNQDNIRNNNTKP